MFQTEDLILEPPADSSITLVMSQRRLYLVINNLASLEQQALERWFNTTDLRFQVQRDELEDNMDDMPTKHDWTRYDDFAKKLANLATSFKRPTPLGKVV